MQATREREGFSRRLREALDQAGWKSIGPSDLAREFNQRNKTGKITLHATRKWLMGEAIPTQARVKALAQWLGVSPEWLRFGVASTADARAGQGHSALPGATAAHEANAGEGYARSALMADIERLNTEQFWVVKELVKILLQHPKARR